MADHADGPEFSRTSSADGRFVLFESDATNLAPGQADTNNRVDDLFLLDRQTGAITLVSHTGDGVTTGNDSSGNAQISADGSAVVFTSSASDLIAGFDDRNGGSPDVYRWSGGVVTLVSHAAGLPTQGGNAGVEAPVISGDGGVIAFISTASDLVANYASNNGGIGDVYRWEGGTVTLVSGAGGSPTVGANGISTNPVLSVDGTSIAFQSRAADLIAGFSDGNGTSDDVYRRSGGTTTLISHAAGNPTQGGDGASLDPLVSDDGSVVVFESTATDLVAGFANNNAGGLDVFRWAGGDAALVSGAGGSATQGSNGLVSDPALSGDGSTVVFEGFGTDHVAGFSDNNTFSGDVYRWTAAGTVYSVDPSTSTLNASGGSEMLTVRTGAGCAWTAASTADWVTLSPASGSGPGNVRFSVGTWNGPARTAALRVADQTATVSQGSGCSVSFAPDTLNVGAPGVQSTVQISTMPGCSWSASSGTSWITVASGTAGSGDGQVQLIVGANPGPARQGSVTIAGRGLPVAQANG